jgi:hypothetical protein
MTSKYECAQLQDVFFSIGGASLSVDMEFGEVYADRLVVPIGILTIPFTPTVVPLKWHQRLWRFLNLDVRDIWNRIKTRD